MYYTEKEGKMTGSILPVARMKACWEQALYDENEIKTPLDAICLVTKRLADEPVEVACVIYMDSSKMPICVATVGMGNDGSVAFNARTVAQMGLMCNASMYILVHNHPKFSGYKNLMSSKADEKMTEAIALACAPLGLYCFDSIIVNYYKGADAMHPAFYSMRQKQAKMLNKANGADRAAGVPISFEKAMTGNIPWISEKAVLPVSGCWEGESLREEKVYVARNAEELSKAFEDMKEER